MENQLNGTTLLTSPFSRETKDRIEKENEDWHFTRTCCEKTLQSYKMGEVTLEKYSKYIRAFAGKSNNVIGEFSLKAESIIPERNRNSPRIPKFIKEISVNAVQRAVEEGFYVNAASIRNTPDKSAFKKVSELWKSRGLTDISESDISSWYSHK